MVTECRYPQVWDLKSLFPHPEEEAFEAVLQDFKNDLQAVADDSDQLAAVAATDESAAAWSQFLQRFEVVSRRAADLKAFAECHAAAEAGNKQFQKLEAVLAALEPLREKAATNVEFALRDVDDACLSSMTAADTWLGQIGFFLEECRRNSRLRLPKDQELLDADLAVDGLHAWGRLYDRVSGDLRIRVMERGKIVKKSPGQVHFDSPEASHRENNFYAADRAWSSIADTCADALNHISGTRLTKYRRLGLTDHLEVPLRKNRMRRETLQAMWSAVTDRKHVLLKYLDRKAELLGLSKLRWYDVQAPLPTMGRRAPTSGKLTYDEACDCVVNTFEQFSPELGNFGRTALENGWIEAEDRSGKRQGGFCTGFAERGESRIFMTFTKTPDSMSTLAHELGHAYHSWVLREQPFFLQDYPMNLAETASTFAEAILGEKRLNTASSTDERASILDNMLGDAVAFLMNIHTRFLFEDQFHKERAQGELSAERFSELMLAAQKEAYLDGLADDGWNPNFWVSKLHFYITELPFYNFPYTFGYLLSLGTFALAGESGDDFPTRYRELLLATGCLQTEEAVQSTLGADLTQPEFWNRSLDIVDQRVEQFLELTA